MRRRKPKRRQFPSESYAARVRRDRVPTPITLSAEGKARLDAAAAEHGLPRGDLVERLLELLEPGEPLPERRRVLEADEVVVHDRPLPRIGKK